MPARVLVRRSLQLGDGPPQVMGDGLTELQPPIPLTPLLQQAFAAGAPLVVIKGALAECHFSLVSDYVEFVKLDAHQPSALWRNQVYEFVRWTRNDAPPEG